MAEEKRYQLTVTNERLIEKIENYASYGFPNRREFICAAILAYENTLMVEQRTERLAKELAKGMTADLKKREEMERHERLANEYL